MKRFSKSLQCRSSFHVDSCSTNLTRIERYTSISTSSATVPGHTSLEQQNTESSTMAPPSPTSSMKTNVSLATTMESHPNASYHPFPAQAARTRHQGIDAATTPSAHSRDASQTHNGSTVTSPRMMSREQSWPADGLRDLHLSGSEPRIFPGVVSRTQRKDSLLSKDGKGSENGDNLLARSNSGVMNGRRGLDESVEEESRRIDDSDEEEAGGMES
jgi:AMP deaminase